MAGFRETLREAVRQFAARTSLDSLKKQGVQQVNVLGLDRIVALVDEAVHSSLKSRLLGIEREAVAEATKAEFLRLLRSNEDLQRQKSEVQRLKERAEEELDMLRRELGLQQNALEARLEQGRLADTGRHEGENAQIAAKVRELFATLASGAGAGVPLEARVLELVMDVIAQDRQAADLARRALRDREVENLQRRIEKLNQSLEQTEHRLRQVAAMKDIDDGISSVYREVQGLRSGESAFGRKRELMAAIFQANLRLQAKGAAKGT
jgi:hypothetical protein